FLRKGILSVYILFCMIPQDRFSELLAKELANVLSPEEAEELQALLADERLRERYDLLQLYLRDHVATRTDDDALFAKIRDRISAQADPAAEPIRESRSSFYWKAASIAAVLLIVSSLLFSLF